MVTAAAASRRANAALRRARARLLRLLGHPEGLGASDRGGGPEMLVLGAAVGLGTGLLAALLIAVIRIVQRLAWGTDTGTLEIVLIPTVGAFAVGLLLHYWFPESRGSGIVRIMSIIALHGGRVRGRVPLGGVAATGVALGTGAAGGREGPIVLIGGAVGSLLGRLFAVDEQRMRTLIAAGAAAGIGASFNAPIGGMLFAIELIIGGFAASSLQVVVVASVVGSVTAREIIGPGIAYRPATGYELGDPLQLLLYAALGLAAVGVGLALFHMEQISARLLSRLPAWLPLRLAAGGLGVGLVALLVPEALGTGEHLPPIDGVREPIQQLLDGGYGVSWTAVAMMLALVGAKLVATSMSVGSGNAVGTFAPALFLGAAAGGAAGTTAALLVPALEIHPGSFALVGMAAVFTVIARAPLTAILIVFELTGDYGLVLPLMLAVGIAMFLADRVQPDSLYAYQLRQQGIVYAEPQDIDVMQTVSVGEVMDSDIQSVPADLPIPQLLQRIQESGLQGFPVVAHGRLFGVVTLTDLSRPDRRGLDDALTVADICTRPPVTVTPQDPMFRALRRMANLDVGRLPVVAADDHSKLVGMIRRKDVVTAYQRAMGRSTGVQQRTTTSRLRNLAGTHLVELVVDGASPVSGKTVREVSWPPRTIIASIHRGDDVVTPDGDTTIAAGDTLIALTAQEATETLRRLVAAPTQRSDL